VYGQVGGTIGWAVVWARGQRFFWLVAERPNRLFTARRSLRQAFDSGNGMCPLPEAPFRIPKDAVPATASSSIESRPSPAGGASAAHPAVRSIHSEGQPKPSARPSPMWLLS